MSLRPRLLLRFMLTLAACDFAFAAPGAGAPTGKVEITIDKAGAMSLDAREVPMAQVLDTLAAKSGKPIRFQDAPDQAVTVTCHGNGMEAVLRCLLGTDADIAFSYQEGNGGQKSLASVKILSSTFLKLPDYPGATNGQGHEPEARTPEEALARLHSKDPGQRARALDQLGRFEQIDKATLATAYNDAMKDQDGDVRAAAVNGLALLDENNSFPMLSAAMSDESASVRLAALDGMEQVNEQSLPYYEQALNDEDDSVRALAELRLGIDQ